MIVLDSELIANVEARENAVMTGTLHITEKQRVSSRGIERTGLSESEIETAKRAYRNEKEPPRSDEGLNYPDLIYRRVRKRPLIVIHLLAIGSREEDLSSSTPVVAWSISFPRDQLRGKEGGVCREYDLVPRALSRRR